MMRWWHVLLVLIGIGMILQAALPVGAAVPEAVTPIEPAPLAWATCLPVRPEMLTDGITTVTSLSHVPSRSTQMNRAFGH